MMPWEPVHPNMDWQTRTQGFARRPCRQRHQPSLFNMPLQELRRKRTVAESAHDGWPASLTSPRIRLLRTAPEDHERMADYAPHRRTLLRAALAGGTMAASGCAVAPQGAALTHSAQPGTPFDAGAFSIAGVFDADWLLDARFTRLLDTMAASPGAFGTVRVFGMLNAGERDMVAPTSSGRVWPAPDAPMDFSIPLAALDALVSRGITPFVALTFFPRAVSAGPVTPPPDGYAAWQRLVRAFLDAAAARFGKAALARWWFEAWNEPNMPPFWAGRFDQYLELYRATSEAVVASGHAVRLGGPALAYLPGEGAPLMERFLAFLHREPRAKCDFISLHRKGIWTSAETEPRLARLEAAARDTADALLRLAPERARGMAVVNDEADMKVAFDTPYEPRMTEQFPAWLAASAILHDRLSAEYAGTGIRFVAAADHANQHLVQAPFDGRRSVMTRLSADPADLVKLPVFHFHEMLRLLGGRHGTVPDASPLPGCSTWSRSAAAAFPPCSPIIPTVSLPPWTSTTRCGTCPGRGSTLSGSASAPPCPTATPPPGASCCRP